MTQKKPMSVPSGNTFPVLTIERGSIIFFGSKNAHSFKKSIANSPSKKWYQKKSIVNLAETILLQRAIRLVTEAMGVHVKHKMLYIPITLNNNLIFWHLKWVVVAVKY